MTDETQKRLHVAPTIAVFFELIGGNVVAGRLFFPNTKDPWARGADLRRRGYLPTKHWPKAMRHARTRGIKLSAETLLAWQRRARYLARGKLRDKTKEGRR